MCLLLAEGDGNTQLELSMLIYLEYFEYLKSLFIIFLSMLFGHVIFINKHAYIYL